VSPRLSLDSSLAIISTPAPTPKLPRSCSITDSIKVLPVMPCSALIIIIRSSQSQRQSQSYLTPDGQSASLSWYQAIIWSPLAIFISLPMQLQFRQLGDCYYVETSLIRGRVCNLPVQMLLGLTSADILRSIPKKLETITYSRLRLSSISIASYVSQDYGRSSVTSGPNKKYRLSFVLVF
jgi:hypothetical protein